jgi:diguanylate cyclase (GGDEF)-like protein
MFLDLDGLKAINDARGHGAGDQALVEVSDALRGSVRSDDIVGRVGGDEFANAA